MTSKFSQSRKIKRYSRPKWVTYPAILGDGNGNVEVSGRTGYVYARVGGRVEQVQNNRVQPLSDMRVTVGRDEQDPQKLGVFQVLSVRTGSPAGPGGGGFMGYAPSRRYRFLAVDGGQDPLWVEGRQILPLGVYPLSGMTIQIQPGPYYTGTDMDVLAYSTKDLTSYIPATSGKALLALITISTAGVVTVTTGSEFTYASVTTLAGILAYQPAIPAGTSFASAFVRLYNGQTAVQEGRNTTDIIDIRSAIYRPDPTSLSDVDYIDFNTAWSGTAAIEGRLSWNVDAGTLQIGMPGGEVVNQIGQEVFLPRRVKKDTAGTILNGQLVYIAGGSGTNATVELAKADAAATALPTIAMATEDFAHTGSGGYCTTLGLVSGTATQPIDTSAYTPGTVLYLSAATAGAFTSTPPTTPNHTVLIGTVFRQHATEGSIIVHIDYSSYVRTVPSTAAQNTIQPSAAVVPLTIKAPATGTPNLLDLQDNTGGGVANFSNSGNLTISNTAPSITLSDTTGSAKDLTIITDGNVAQLRESAGASGSLINIDLVNNRVAIGSTAPPTHFFVKGTYVGAFGNMAIDENGAGYSWISFMNGATRRGWFGYNGSPDGMTLSGGTGVALSFYSSDILRLQIATTGAITIPNGTASVVPFTVKMAASQTANGVNITNSSDAILANINKDGGFVFNEQGVDTDSRIEGDTDANLTYWDAGADKVGIGTATPTSKLDVSGDIETGSANAFYFGDPTTDGTWRFIRSGNDLNIERRESGSWVSKSIITP